MLKAWCIHESVTIASKMLQIQRKSDKHSRTHIRARCRNGKAVDEVGKQIGRGTQTQNHQGADRVLRQSKRRDALCDVRECGEGGCTHMHNRETRTAANLKR